MCVLCGVYVYVFACVSVYNDEYISVEGTCEYMSVEGTYPNSSIQLHNQRHGKQQYYYPELSGSHSKYQPEWVLEHNKPPCMMSALNQFTIKCVIIRIG